VSTPEQTSSEEFRDFDYVPVELELPPEVVAAPPPVVSRASLLPSHQLTWENFERLCVCLARLEGEIEHCRLYGTRGQEQQGIDLYAKPRGQEKYHAYQCKRYQEFGAADIRNAVKAFREGSWSPRCSRFVLCTSASGVATELAEEYERQRTALAAENVKFLLWDAEEISRQLKTQPALVDDFFGRAWLSEFCGADYAAKHAARLDGARVTQFREQMRRFYEVLIEQLDPGIPAVPSQRNASIPLGLRYVLPDIQTKGDLSDAGRRSGESQAATSSTDQAASSNLKPAPGAARSPAMSYALRQPVGTWMAQAKRSLVEGGPGTGKSTLLRYLTLEILSQAPSDLTIAPWMKLLPVWVPFGFWTKQISDGNSCSLVECVRRWLSLWNQDSLWPILEPALQDARALLLIDGLDEWTTIEAGRMARDQLQVFLRTQGAAAIATSRPFGGITLEGADWQTGEVAPLTREQQAKLCEKWFTLAANDSSPVGQAAIAQQVSDFMAEISRSRDLEELAAVPLLLVSLISVHFRRGVLPTDRFSAYQQLIDYLIEEHPARRQAGSLNAADSGYAPLREREVKSTFAYIAFSEYPETVLPADRILTLVEKFLNGAEGLDLGLEKLEARALAERFARIAEGACGLLIKQGFDARSFLHRSLQEFLVSSHIASQPLDRQRYIFQAHFFDRRWREILLGTIWNTRRTQDVEALLAFAEAPAEVPTEEMYRSEFLAEVAFGPFVYPTSKAKSIAGFAFERIQRYEWMPHRRRLLLHALSGLDSARTRGLVRGKIGRWAYSRLRYRSWWVEGLRGWPKTPDTIDVLFDLLNDEGFDIQRSAATTLLADTPEFADRLIAEFQRTCDPYRQAAILHALIRKVECARIETLVEFAQGSRSDALRLAAISAHVHFSQASDRDFNELLELGGSQRFGLSQSSDIAGLLERGWANTPQLRSVCLKAVNMMGPSRYLEHSIAIHVLLSSFPGDPQVAAYAIDQIQTQNFPFVSLNFGAFELLAKSFRDYAPLVAAIDEWAPKQQHRDPELSHAALVGRTPVMKQILLQDLRTSTLPFWAANALTAGWGLEDAEVRAGLVDLIKGPVAKASAIAHYGPQLLSRDEAKSRLDEMLADPTSRWHGKILHTLAEMPLSESERRGVATTSIGLLDSVPYLDRLGFAGKLILDFHDFPEVRDFALRRLKDREPPVAEIAQAYASDSEIRAKVIEIISPLPLALRYEVIERLARGDDDQFATGVLADYDDECDAQLKTRASVAYHRRLLLEGQDVTPAIVRLSERIRAYGMDMEERRQAALAGLVVLGRLDVMTSQSEWGEGSKPLRVSLTEHGMALNLVLARVLAESWESVKSSVGSDLENRFSEHGTWSLLWPALARVASDLPGLHAEILEHCEHDEPFSRCAEALSFLSRVRPHSELLRGRAIRAVTQFDGREWGHLESLRTATALLEAQFDDRRDIAQEIAKDRHPSSNIVIALAALDPQHPFVVETWQAIQHGQPSTLFEYFAAAYACIPAKEFLKLLAGDIENRHRVDPFSSKNLLEQVLRRVKRDRGVQAEFESALSAKVPKNVKANAGVLLARAGLLTEETRQACAEEANSEMRAGMIECGFDLSAGLTTGLPLVLLDATEGSAGATAPLLNA
jgi:hypothetical protein